MSESRGKPDHHRRKTVITTPHNRSNTDPSFDKNPNDPK